LIWFNKFQKEPKKVKILGEKRAFSKFDPFIASRCRNENCSALAPDHEKRIKKSTASIFVSF
jgi:hypothetical protein